MFRRENIKFNVMIYMMIWFGFTFYDYGTFTYYLFRGPVIGNIIVNSAWLYFNLMIESIPQKTDEVSPEQK